MLFTANLKKFHWSILLNWQLRFKSQTYQTSAHYMTACLICSYMYIYGLHIITKGEVGNVKHV